MEKLSQKRANEILDSISDRRIVVLGDVMLDEFVWGDVTRISPEAPVPVVDVRRESIHLGGAANVLANLVAFGTKGSVIGVVGNDAIGTRLRESLNEFSEGTLITDSSRPSTSKTRIVAHNDKAMVPTKSMIANKLMPTVSSETTFPQIRIMEDIIRF